LASLAGKTQRGWTTLDVGRRDSGLIEFSLEGQRSLVKDNLAGFDRMSDGDGISYGGSDWTACHHGVCIDFAGLRSKPNGCASCDAVTLSG
jgi:hypothetical protein